MRDRENEDMGRMDNLSEGIRQEDNIRDDRAAGGSSGPSMSSERFDSDHPNQYERHDGDAGGMTDSSGHSGDVETRDFNHENHRPGETASMGGGSHHMSSGMGAGGAAYSNMSSTSGPSSQEGIHISEDQMQTGGGGSGQRREFGSTGGAEGAEGGSMGGTKSSGTPEDSSDQMQTGGGGSGSRREFGNTSGAGSSGGMSGSSEGNEG